jgi:hypothetical protein
MHPTALSLISGVAFGAVAVALMLPMSFPNKRTALFAAFASRFASLPDAIVTKAYVPILIIGVLGGALIGFIAGGI